MLTATRPEHVEVHGISVLVLLLAVFFAIPNRLLTTAAIGIGIGVGFCGIAIGTFDAGQATLASQTISVLSVVAIGILHTSQLERVRREEFLSLRHERSTTARLEAEVARRPELLEGELRELAERDPLTSLLNRRAFFRDAVARISHAVGRRSWVVRDIDTDARQVADRLRDRIATAAARSRRRRHRPRHRVDRLRRSRALGRGRGDDRLVAAAGRHGDVPGEGRRWGLGVVPPDRRRDARDPRSAGRRVLNGASARSHRPGLPVT